jgi:hypothetical protein
MFRFSGTTRRRQFATMGSHTAERSPPAEAIHNRGHISRIDRGDVKNSD